MFTPATAIAIDSPTIQQLESLVRSGNTPQRIAQRCRVILLAGQGVANHSIARELGLSRPTVIAARAAFEDGGVEALTAKPTRKRSRRVLTPELEREILDTTLKTRPADATQWSVRTLAKQMHVSRMMVYRVWERFDIQPHRVEKFGSSAEFVGKTVFHRRLRRPRCSPSLKASLASSAAAPALTLGCAPRCRLVWAMGNGASGGGSGHRV